MLKRMVISMQSEMNILIRYRIDRAKETINEARDAIKNNHPFNAANRIYYAIFYIVSALAIKDGFSTSKHSQLLGWFNKNFVKSKIISVDIANIYFNAFRKRQKGDYEDLSNISLDEVKEDFDKMIIFISEIESLIFGKKS